MSESLFLAGCALIFAGLLSWGFRTLPAERWQMLAVVPLHKHPDNSWHGANITYYGFFIATSQLFAVLLLLILLGSLGISLTGTLLATALLLSFCLPAARLVALLVEKKHHTFTIGGASFVGILLAPWCILAAERLLTALGEPGALPVLPMLAAMSISYTLGEGLGRLGCISFGCCYGKPLAHYNKTVQKLLRRLCFSFSGSTQKAVYEGRLAGQALVPIQAITAIFYTCTALAGCFLFLHRSYSLALLITIIVSQGWRVVSETMRADFRGFATFSIYQRMCLVSIIYMAGALLLLPQQTGLSPSLTAGISSLWQPGLILGLQGLWLLFFYIFGRSTVTTSQVTFELIHEHV